MKRKWLAVAAGAVAVVAVGTIGVAMVTSSGTPRAGAQPVFGAGTTSSTAPGTGSSIHPPSPTTTVRPSPTTSSSTVHLPPAGQLVRIGQPAAGPPQPPAGPPTNVPPVPSVTRQITLGAMPNGIVTFGTDQAGQLAASISVIGLTPGSAHDVEIDSPSAPVIHFGMLRADGFGQARAIVNSTAAPKLPAGAMFVIRLGTPNSGAVATEAIAETVPLPANPVGRQYSLRAADVTPGGADLGTLAGVATLTYNPATHTVTIQLTATGLFPGGHAVHIHVGTCAMQGPPKYMPAQDFVADQRGDIVGQTRTIQGVSADPLTAGFYLNLHLGTSASIVHNGAVTPDFRPLLCGDL